MERGIANPTLRTVERLLEVAGRVAHVAPRSAQLRTPGVLRELSHGDAPAVEWLVEGLIARGAVTLLAGAPGAGKSLLGQWLAAAAVNGGGADVGIPHVPRLCAPLETPPGGELPQP